MDGPLKGANTIMLENIDKTFPADAAPQLVAEAIAEAVAAPVGQKPFRIAVDPFQDASDEIMSLADQKHQEFLDRCGISEVCSLKPS